MTVLQASLLSRTFPLSLPSPSHLPPLQHRPTSLSNHNPLSLSPQFRLIFKKFQSLSSHRLSIRCTLNSESIAPGDASFSRAVPDTKDAEFIENGEKVEVFNGVSEVGLEKENGDVVSGSFESSTSSGSSSEGQNGNLVVEEKEGGKGRIGIMVFLVGVWALLKRGYEKLLGNGWLSWLPFWRQEKRLERLIAEADAEPKDAAKQSALLVELNKHRLDLN